jgi:uncharacterized protein DUF1573
MSNRLASALICLGIGAITVVWVGPLFRDSISAGSVAGTGLSLGDTVPPNAMEPLRVNAEELQLGHVFETDRCEHSFHITNVSANPITIKRFEKTCDCTSIEPNSAVEFKSGETKAFQLVLRLKSRELNLESAGELHQVKFRAVYIEDNLVAHSSWWELACTVLPTIRMSEMLEIGMHSVREECIEKPFELFLPDAVVDVEFGSSPDWSVELGHAELQPVGKKFTAIVRSKSKMTPRLVNDPIRVTPIGHGDKRLPSKMLAIKGEIVDDVIALPRDLCFGRVKCGMEAAEAIQLQSVTNRRFKVKNVIASSPDISVIPVTGSAGIFSVRVQFKSTGDQAKEIKLLIEDEGGGKWTVRVPITYFGEASN